MEEEAKHHSIVTYKKDRVGKKKKMSKLKARIQKKCGDCKIRHLAAIGAFILDFESSEHAAATEMKDIPNVDHVTEDSAVFMESHQERQTSACNHVLLLPGQNVTRSCQIVRATSQNNHHASHSGPLARCMPIVD